MRLNLTQILSHRVIGQFAKSTVDYRNAWVTNGDIKYSIIGDTDRIRVAHIEVIQ